MTPKEKALNLVNKYIEFTEDNYAERNADAKQCALIAVDEVIKINPCYEDSDRGGNFMWNDNTYYWQEVKTEIEKL